MLILVGSLLLFNHFSLKVHIKGLLRVLLYEIPVMSKLNGKKEVLKLMCVRGKNK